ncbi:FAD:protein FMN transferase [Sulfurivirga sp.]|uniref:FAD:protein FMN transferase n=1 Tax=Sulfurivirga sp. TaxID=2614236 RepID=UPI0025F1F205|nr:FAD:protein FMN transferase [Sulfurivirga sp.]
MRKSLVLILPLTVLLAGCQPSEAPAPAPQQTVDIRTAPVLKPHKQTFHVFGTLVHVTLYADSSQRAREAFGHIARELQAFHQRWHAWEPGGLLYRVNTAFLLGHSIKVPADMAAFIQKSKDLYRLSEGYFDPSIGALINLWGFHSDTPTGPPPTEKQLRTWMQHRPTMDDVVVIENTISARNNLAELDFGANAKGLALDQVLNYLKQAGIEHAIINIGGDMKALGLKPGGQPWRIGVADPHNPERSLARIDLQAGEAIVTSGTYERFFDWNGHRYSHIINPHTARPAEGILSVTVIHRDAITADAAATALLAAGPEKWREVAQKMGLSQVAVILEDGRLEMTEAMKKRWQPLEKQQP